MHSFGPNKFTKFFGISKPCLPSIWISWNNTDNFYTKTLKKSQFIDITKKGEAYGKRRKKIK